MARIDCNGCPSQKQPTTGSRQGPRQAREGGRRLIWLIQLADLAQAGDHLWSLRPAPYVVQTYTTNAGWVHGSLPFVDFFSEFACDTLGSDSADSDLLTPDSSA